MSFPLWFQSAVACGEGCRQKEKSQENITLFFNRNIFLRVELFLLAVFSLTSKDEYNIFLTRLFKVKKRCEADNLHAFLLSIILHPPTFAVMLRQVAVATLPPNISGVSFSFQSQNQVYNRTFSPNGSDTQRHAYRLNAGRRSPTGRPSNPFFTGGFWVGGKY
jgi:hypothetical protein